MEVKLSRPTKSLEENNAERTWNSSGLACGSSLGINEFVRNKPSCDILAKNITVFALYHENLHKVELKGNK